VSASWEDNGEDRTAKDQQRYEVMIVGLGALGRLPVPARGGFLSPAPPLGPPPVPHAGFCIPGRARNLLDFVRRAAPIAPIKAPKRVVVIHCTRTYTARQKLSAGHSRAIFWEVRLKAPRARAVSEWLRRVA
jgi:hypothetical protein